MKKTDTVRRFFLVPNYEVRAIEEYLEQMAQDGLFFIRRKGAIWYFKKGQPKKLRYYVDIFDKASWFDTRPESDTLDYLEYCNNSGWEYIFTDGKYQFFCSEKEDTVAIETDQKQQLKMIHEASAAYCIAVPIILMLSLFPGIKSLFMELTYGPIALIEYPLTLLGIDLMLLTIIIIELFIVARYITFYLKNRMRVKRGEEIQFSSLKEARKFQNGCLILFLMLLLLGIILLCMINIKFGLVIVGTEALVFGIVWGLSFVGQKNERNNSRIYNMRKSVLLAIVTLALVFTYTAGIGAIMLSKFVFDGNSKVVTYIDENGDEVNWYISQDEIPYTLEDIGIDVPKEGYRDSSFLIDRMLLCSSEDYYESYYADVESDAVYTIGYSKYEFFNSAVRETWVKEYLLKEKNCTVESSNDLAKLWNAENAYIIETEVDGEHDTEVMIEYEGKCYLLTENLMEKTELMDILN